MALLIQTLTPDSHKALTKGLKELFDKMDVVEVVDEHTNIYQVSNESLKNLPDEIEIGVMITKESDELTKAGFKDIKQFESIWGKTFIGWIEDRDAINNYRNYLKRYPNGMSQKQLSALLNS